MHVFNVLSYIKEPQTAGQGTTTVPCLNPLFPPLGNRWFVISTKVTQAAPTGVCTRNDERKFHPPTAAGTEERACKDVTMSRRSLMAASDMAL